MQAEITIDGVTMQCEYTHRKGRSATRLEPEEPECVEIDYVEIGGQEIPDSFFNAATEDKIKDALLEASHSERDRRIADYGDYLYSLRKDEGLLPGLFIWEVV